MVKGWRETVQAKSAMKCSMNECQTCCTLLFFSWSKVISKSECIVLLSNHVLLTRLNLTAAVVVTAGEPQEGKREKRSHLVSQSS